MSKPSFIDCKPKAKGRINRHLEVTKVQVWRPNVISQYLQFCSFLPRQFGGHFLSILATISRLTWYLLNGQFRSGINWISTLLSANLSVNWRLTWHPIYLYFVRESKTEMALMAANLYVNWRLTWHPFYCEFVREFDHELKTDMAPIWPWIHQWIKDRLGRNFYCNTDHEF